MEDSLKHIYSVLKDSGINTIDKSKAFYDFIKTTNVDENLINSISNFEKVSSLFQYIYSLIYQLNISNKTQKDNKDTMGAIFDFIFRLGTGNQFLRDTISYWINFDKFISIIFTDDFVLDIKNANAKETAQILKVIASLASSPLLEVKEENTYETIINIVTTLMDNVQLSSWCCAIIAFLCNYHTHFNAAIKSRKNILDIKAKIEAFQSSNDPYLVLSSVAALTKLFDTPMTAATINLRCAVSQIIQSTPYLIMSQLASIVILKLVEKTKLNSQEVQALVKGIIKTKGIDSYVILYTLESLPDYYGEMIDVLKEGTTLQRILLHLFKSNNISFIVSCCHFFRVLLAYDETLLDLEPENDTFYKLLTLFNGFDECTYCEKYEASLVIINSIFQKRTPNEEELILIHDNENNLFTSLVRYIERGDSYCAICFYSFIKECLNYFPKWNQRLSKIIINLPFIPLVLSSLRSSSNIYTTRDVMRVFKQLLNTSDYVFEMCTQTELEIVRNDKDITKDNMHGMEMMINELQQTCFEQSIRLTQLEIDKKEYEEYVENNHKKYEDTEVEIVKIHKERDIILNENEELKKQMKQLTKQIDLLSKENSCLNTTVLSSNARCETVSNTNEDLGKKIEELTKKNEALESDLDEQRIKFSAEKIEKTCIKKQLDVATKDNEIKTKGFTEASGQLIKAKNNIEKHSTENGKLIALIKRMKVVIIENERNIKDLTLELEKVRVHLKTEKEAAEKYRNDYIKSTKSNYKLLQVLNQLETDKNKWEVISKVSHHIKEKTRESLNETFNPLF